MIKFLRSPPRLSGSSRASVTDNQGLKIVQKITIDRPALQLYRFWRDLSNLPRFMPHLESVRVIDSKRSHWTVCGPVGALEWDAEIINDKEPELLAWRSSDGADLANAGTVRFQPAPFERGTEVIVSMEYVPPAGQLGRAFAKFLSETHAQQIHDDLRRFKWLMETGEIPTTAGQPSGPPK